MKTECKAAKRVADEFRTWFRYSISNKEAVEVLQLKRLRVQIKGAE